MSDAYPLDVLMPRPRVLFVGINPSLRSAETGHNYAGRGNPFYRLLHAAGLTPTLRAPEESRDLLGLGLALTNLCGRPTRAASELSRDELLEGRARLARVILKIAPSVVAFVGVSIYRLYFSRARSGGAGAKPERIPDPDGARVYVVPNPQRPERELPWLR